MRTNFELAQELIRQHASEHPQSIDMLNKPLTRIQVAEASALGYLAAQRAAKLDNGVGPLL